MTEVRIRPGTGDDLPHLAAIERDASQRYRDIGYDFCAEGAVREPWEQQKALDEGAVLVAEAANGKLVAFALVWPADGRAHLLELAVALAYQGRGVGRRLVDAVESWARGRGFAEITLTCFRDVPWNGPWYARLGYRVFEPDETRSDLRAVQAEEARWGYARKPRLAMAKNL